MYTLFNLCKNDTIIGQFCIALPVKITQLCRRRSFQTSFVCGRKIKRERKKICFGDGTEARFVCIAAGLSPENTLF